MAKFVFGPVPSRRLGFSLGVDIIPRKYCSFDCIYCQVGKTTHKGVERQSFSDPDAVVAEVMERVGEGGRIDMISLSGSGEPTLNSDVGAIIGGIKEKTSIPVAVITNASLFFREDVRREVALADLVLPSLDATGEVLFERINRPHEAISFDRLVGGLKAFRSVYGGRIWLEIMLIKQMNDSIEHLEIFNQLIIEIGADRVQLNTVSRPPLEETAKGLDAEELISAARHIGGGCEIIGAFGRRTPSIEGQTWREAVVATLQRRSMSLDDIVRTTGVSPLDARVGLERLVKEGRIGVVTFGGQAFYVANPIDKQDA